MIKVSIRKWIKIFNSNATATVTVIIWFTPYFDVQRGTRQGDPIALCIFVLLL